MGMAAKRTPRRPNLNASQLRTFSEALLLIHSPLDPPSVPHATIAALERLLPGDCYAYNEFHDGRVVNISAPFDLDGETIQAFQTYLGEHPSINHILETHTKDAVRLSDVCSHRQWRATNLYNHVFRPTNFNYQVGALFPIGTASTAGFSVNRVSLDFTAGQRDLMTLLVPHFTQAWARANAMAQRDSALASVAVAEVDASGRILFATEKASALIARYRARDSLSPRALSEPFRGWLLQNIKKAEGLNAYQPLVLETEGRRVTVRLAVLPGRDRFQLHFDERALVTAGRLAAHFALTPRQGEVLYWIAEGKSNEEIGLILGPKTRTIAKHVEQIFARIGVENRSSASRLCHEHIASLQP
jgi:DNA-binding CsgD family transcriptional regulator